MGNCCPNGKTGYKSSLVTYGISNKEVESRETHICPSIRVSIGIHNGNNVEIKFVQHV